MNDGFQFFDGDEDRSTQDGNEFILLHFREHSMDDVELSVGEQSLLKKEFFLQEM